MLRAFIIFSFMGIAASLPQKPDFRDEQKKYERVRNAYKLNEDSVKLMFQRKGIDYSAFEIYLRAFKKEKLLQLFVRSKSDEKFKLVKNYQFCYLSGELGPKRKQGDYQVPEGFYHVDRFNPVSSFHLSLGINYPNTSDRDLGVKGSLGGDIFIHGNCVSIGCIPITDKEIKELYIIAVEAKSKGQSRIPAHIFPARMHESGMVFLQDNDENKMSFWKNLKEGYDHFEEHKQLPAITVNSSGKYVIK